MENESHEKTHLSLASLSTSLALDVATPMSLSIDEMRGSPDGETSLYTKNIVASTNALRGVAADEDVSMVVSLEKKSHGVASDAPESELSL